MLTKILPLAALPVGVILLILSATWPEITDKNKVWTPEQHAALSAAKRSAHDSQHGHSHDDGSHEEHDASVEKLKQSLAEFQQARNGRENFVNALRWAGIICIAVGATGFYIDKNSSNS